ncbi:NAD(P)-binding protein [Bimuria novae-zelandiae CBS 107.79]|uniref:NAD(P)-binding protein n=1 Tax=Bimuria novae-zelandiae CBS 107.79 TaxID=1447943 RepID=A0A6A5VHJ2_9PLEO|nr:NAD(P)-binding protein [Bimuria novae-zelandiae CBS 107.79]
MPSAIVTGATGILGREIVFELSKHAPQWPTIHALSRSKKEDYPSNVIHSHIDLTSSADGMAADLAKVRGEYVFFAAYLQKDSEQENWDVNGAMLSNFLEVLTKTGAIERVKRIILVTGAKQYGVHLGAPKNPMHEDAPWLTGSQWPPNFYYNQQNILHDFCSQHGKEWTVTYPNDVIGFARGNFMNLSTALALYALVEKEMGRGDELVFPGSPAFYTGFDSFTCSKLHARFCAWVALEPRAANEAFNVVNGDVNPEQFAPAEASVSDLAEKPPVEVQADELGLRGHEVTRQSKVEQQVDLVNWSQRDDVKAAWERLADREKLDKSAFEKATWGFLGFVLGRNFDLVISMSKARKYGWTGYQDTWDSFESVFEDLEASGVLPKKS